MASNVLTRFSALLGELEEEHEREIRSLKAENAALRLQAGLSEAVPGSHDLSENRPVTLEDVQLAPLAALVASGTLSEAAVPVLQNEGKPVPEDSAQLETEATPEIIGSSAEAIVTAVVEESIPPHVEAQNGTEAVELDVAQVCEVENAPLLRPDSMAGTPVVGAIVNAVVAGAALGGGAEADAAGGGAVKGAGIGNPMEAAGDVSGNDNIDDAEVVSNVSEYGREQLARAECQSNSTSDVAATVITPISVIQKGTSTILFHLKCAWIDMPVASGVWGQELDEIIAERDIRKLVAHTEGLPEPKGKRISVGGHVLVYSRPVCVVDPGSTSRMVWDIMGMCLISYDVINIPLMAFEYEDNFFTLSVSWITLLFWTADMFASVFTGYYAEGELVMEHCRIISNYLKTWFAVDCIVVIPDWIMTLMGSTTNVAGLGRLLRAARAVRVLRLLRLLKLQKLINAFYDMIESEYMFIVVNLAKLLLFILVLNHLVACCWFFVGSIGRGSGGTNWLEDAGKTPVADEDLAWKYTTALHWSITQFTPASMDISATNTGERVFSIFILFWALVALSSVIGSVSASMTALRNMKGDEQKQMWLLRRYLRQRRVSKSLMARIMKYTEHTTQAKQNTLAPKQVSLLGTLSEQLSLELSSAINSPVLAFHPMFRSLLTYFPVVIHRICNTALQQKHFAVNDHVFDNGDEAVAMHFVKAGTFEYRRRDPPLCKNTFVSEPTLWTSWRHRGDMVAMQEPSEILAIFPGPFSTAMRLHPRPWEFARRYGMHFVSMLNRTDRSSITDIIFDQEFFDRSTRLEERRAGREVAKEELPRQDEENLCDWEEDEE